MNLNIEFPSTIEHAVRERALAAGLDMASYVVNVVKAEVSEDVQPALKRRMTHEEFMARLDQIIRTHGISNDRMDDSRESIYAGRGE